jgi:glucose/arabinose dehydrogenase
VTSPTPVVVVRNINADGKGGAPMGHWTRTLAFDASHRLYISVGSYANVDSDSYRARIRRFPAFTDNVPSGGVDFTTAEVFADGLRNEVGLAFDETGVLWGVENGPDKLYRADLGGDIHEDNPAEELNRFPESQKGQSWGYPYCFTEYDIPNGKGLGRGTIWAWPSFMGLGTYTDAWCRANTNPPALAMQGHSAPLGMTFYRHDAATLASSACRAPSGQGGFPKAWDGDAFVGFHGSWNRDVPTGYKVVRIPITTDPNTGAVTAASPIDILKSEGPGAKWASGFRPVDVDFDPCGRLMISSDGSRLSDATYTKGSLVMMRWAAAMSPTPSTPTSGGSSSNSSSSGGSSSSSSPAPARSEGTGGGSTGETAPTGPVSCQQLTGCAKVEKMSAATRRGPGAVWVVSLLLVVSVALVPGSPGRPQRNRATDEGWAKREEGRPGETRGSTTRAYS